MSSESQPADGSQERHLVAKPHLQPHTHNAYYNYYHEQLVQSHLLQTLVSSHPEQDWRMRSRLKTVSVALVVCLNIGIDPPDVYKPHPCAKLESWVDPFSLPPAKALETIGRNLQQQYEVWQPRARYRACLDPSLEDLKKTLLSLRRSSKDERILFHYNGHGVPKPTPGGEIWVFNKNYTQYIPVSLYDLQTWIGSPAIYVVDCSSAGHVLNAFERFAEQRDKEYEAHANANGNDSDNTQVGPPNANATASSNIAMTSTNDATQTHAATRTSSETSLPSTSSPAEPNPPSPTQLQQQHYTPYRECILLGACSSTQTLPMSPDLPADLFTCCLTTPIEIGLRWFVLQNPILHNVTPDMILRLPGRLSDRRTPLGELNWIFTAITDTIAWNILPPEMFKKLFRQDLMVAALFRNFLLADRIMRHYNCTPLSYPKLPESHTHHLWLSWDLAADMCLSQLPRLVEETSGRVAAEGRVGEGGSTAALGEQPRAEYSYTHSRFFAEQLTAFEIWLGKQGVSSSATDYQKPEQLPIILQVLLSQTHRLRALMLLSRFLDLGPWAVTSSLSVGIFPYVLKLLQSPSLELKPVLVFIWAKLLASDNSAQGDLVKDNGYAYFVSVLCSNDETGMPNLSQHRSMAAFVLATFCNNFTIGKEALLKTPLMAALLHHIHDPDPLLRQWCIITFGAWWESFDKTLFLGNGVEQVLVRCLKDESNNVRAATVWALGRLICHGDECQEEVQTQDGQDDSLQFPLTIAIKTLECLLDASHAVRMELVILLSRVVSVYISKFITTAFEYYEEDRRQSGASSSSHLKRNPRPNTSYSVIWTSLLILATDPVEQVRTSAQQVLDSVNWRMVNSSIAKGLVERQQQLLDRDKEHEQTDDRLNGRQSNLTQTQNLSPDLANSEPVSPSPGTIKAKRSSASVHSTSISSSSYFMGTLRRSASFARSLVSASSPSLNTSSVLPDTPPSKTDIPPATVPNDTPQTPTKSQLQSQISSLLLPLPSSYFSHMSSYFATPQMRNDDEPGSVAFNERLWHLRRNTNSLNEASALYPYCPFRKFETVVSSVPESNPTLLCWHPFEQVLLTSDQHTVNVWDWKEGQKRSSLQLPTSISSSSLSSASSSTTGPVATALGFINEVDQSLLYVGSNDGVLRIYSDWDSEMALVAAWRALSDVSHGSRTSERTVLSSPFSSATHTVSNTTTSSSMNSFHNPPGGIWTLPRPKSMSKLLVSWQQPTGIFAVGGSSRNVKFWDVERESCVLNILTQSDEMVTALRLDSDAFIGNNIIPGDLNLVTAGFLDGSIHVFDTRLPAKESLVQRFLEHTMPIQTLKFHHGFGGYLVSASTNGVVKFWDPRKVKSSVKTVELMSSPMSASVGGSGASNSGGGVAVPGICDVHDYAPLMACSVHSSTVRVFNTDGTALSTISSQVGFLGSRVGDVKSLQFHQHGLLLAVGTAGAGVRILSSEVGSGI